MATFNDFLQTLETDLGKFAESSLINHKDSILQDGKTFVEQCKEDLEAWTAQLSSGELSRDDFEWLVKSKKDLAELVALKEAGLAKAALDAFVNGLVDLDFGHFRFR